MCAWFVYVLEQDLRRRRQDLRRRRQAAGIVRWAGGQVDVLTTCH